MTKDNIDWKKFAKSLLWRNIVQNKNEYSGYDIITNDIPAWCKDKPEEACQRGYKPGDIVPDVSFLSYWIGPTKRLTWKELALELGLFNEQLVPDGHDCHKCPKEKTCFAYFKYDPDQERCSCWKEEYSNNKDSREK